MTPITALAREPLVLPSDQDASGRTLGEREIELVTEAIRTGTLTSTKGAFVKRLEKSFAEKLSVPFAYVDPKTLNVTAQTIEPMIGKRTRAIIVTHLFGNPCDMGPILELARARDIPVIEDSAQAFLAEWNGHQSGTMGTIGCFSLQQGKHMTCGEGGLVVTSDARLARRLFLFINKCYGYGDAAADHYYIALNSRMSEVQGAVALGQLQKLGACADRREKCAR